MISPFEPVELQRDTTQVMPLEFESLDEPESPPLEALKASLETEWSDRVARLEARLLEQEQDARRALDALRQEAEAERERVEAESRKSIAEARSQVATTLEGFAGERERYFTEVEGEVVQLALAVAERVLHREVAMDPVVLRAAVRVALERVAGEGPVTLRVAAGCAASWRSVLNAEQSDGAVAVMEDAHLSSGDAVLETAVGRVDLGVREQLKEIERGFFDLLAKRPR